MKKPFKAYANTEFLNSPTARPIRILAEFLEPLARFKREGITNTMVLFGSARVLSPGTARKRLRAAERKLGSAAGSAKGKAAEELQEAQVGLEMSAYYRDAARLTYLLTKWSKTLNRETRFAICSGGGPGIMEAANHGAQKAGGQSIGLNISLGFEQDANRYISRELTFEFHYFFMRKFWFLYPAKGLIMFPGGYGTLDELFEVLTLVQTGKVTKPMPIILYGRKYWNAIINFEEMVRLGVISRSDLDLFTFADTPREAFTIMKKRLQEIFAKRAHIGILHG